MRNAFLNWDKDASGKLDYGEFRADSASSFLEFLNLNFVKMASPWSHVTATPSTWL